jgi:hypothetical protein
VIYTGHTQKNGADLIVNTIKTAPFFCVCPVYCKSESIFMKEAEFKRPVLKFINR